MSKEREAPRYEPGHKRRKWGQPTQEGIDESPAHAQSIVKNQVCLLHLLIGELEPEEGRRLPSGDARREDLAAPGPPGFRSASGSSSYSFIDTGSITFVPT